VWRKGIDTIRFDPRFKSGSMRERMGGGGEDDFLLVYVGRLGFEKRLKDIKEVLELLPDNVRMCFVGKGPHDDQLKTYMEGTRSVFLGQLGGDELSQTFASADCFIMPSDSETLGFVVLESMASGTPVVAANAGGIPDLIDSGETSFLVEAGNASAFAEKIKLLMEDGGMREEMGRRARAEAERWNWEAATSILRNVQYAKAIANFNNRAFGGYGTQQGGLFQRLVKFRAYRLKRKIMMLFGRAWGAGVGVGVGGPNINRKGSVWEKWNEMSLYRRVKGVWRGRGV